MCEVCGGDCKICQGYCFVCKNERVACVCMEIDESRPHPWEEFLKARGKAILWMKKEFNRTDKQIAYNLTIDEEQVYLIRTYLEKDG